MRCRCSIRFSSCEWLPCTPCEGGISEWALADAEVRFRLLFMTYNGWVMLAVAVGAFVGYMVFGSESATKSVACH